MLLSANVTSFHLAKEKKGLTQIEQPAMSISKVDIFPSHAYLQGEMHLAGTRHSHKYNTSRITLVYISTAPIFHFLSHTRPSQAARTLLCCVLEITEIIPVKESIRQKPNQSEAEARRHGAIAGGDGHARGGEGQARGEASI